MVGLDNFRILIIDDNPAIHLDFIKILKTSATTSKLDDLSDSIFGEKNKTIQKDLPKFEIDVASQGQEGVKRIQDALLEKKPYSLAFVDIRMPPGWDGIETIKHIWALDNTIQIVICTAYSDYSWEETVAHLGRTDNLLILKKPFDNISVRQLACALTTKWKLAEDTRRYTNTLKQQVEDRTLSLQESLSLVKSTFESSSDGILVLNNEGTIIDYNQKLLSLLDIPQAIIETKSEAKLLDFLKDKIINPNDFFSRIQYLRIQSDEISVDVIKFKEDKIFECYSQPHKLDKKIIGRILDFRDITKRAKLENELKYQATHDALTGLANRVKLLEGMHLAIKTAAQNQTKFAVLFLDFDRFKLVNDSFSHAAGDTLLQMAANRLQTRVGPEDTLARLGGDEFVIIYMNLKEEGQIEEKVQKLLAAFEEPFEINERKVTLTASIGVSFFPKDATTVDSLLRNADAAMYRAKAQKGNIFQLYTASMSIESLAELDQESELRQAIANNEFFLCYQPEIDVATENLVAVEALIRWQHPKKGELLPMDFIPLAEETGLIQPIGAWIIRTACLQNKAWQDQGFPPIRVAVNVYSQQFRQSDLVETIRTILKETKLKPEYLELELTENVMLSNREIIRTIGELKKLGVSIAIDDFGTGFSSLSYLHKIPLDRLKIDSSFVKHIKSIGDDEVIIRAVISMAKNLNLEVIAEGVETKDQLNFLKRYECGDVQGSYFSKPLLISELEKIMKK